MWMLASRVDLELRQHFTADLIFRKHTSNRIANNGFRLSLHSVPDCLGSQTRVTGVPSVATLVTLVPGVMKFFAIREDDEVTRIFICGVSRLVLAHQDHRNIGCDTTNGFVFTIDDPPLLIELCVSL